MEKEEEVIVQMIKDRKELLEKVSGKVRGVGAEHDPGTGKGDEDEKLKEAKESFLRKAKGE